MGLTKALKKEKIDAPVVDRTVRPLSDEKDRPPSYHADDAGAPDITAAFAALNLERKERKPTIDECIAHLKLLEAINTLREDVGHTDGLYGLFDRFASDIADETKRNEVLAKIREKRWGIFVLMATRRFETWFESIEKGSSKATLELMETPQYETIHKKAQPLQFTPDTLPPLDILMVWHTFILNPRKFLSDCIRHNKIGLWRAGMPWKAVTASIDNNTFEFIPGARAREGFMKATGLPWNNLESPPGVSVSCPRCRAQLTAPLTTAIKDSDWNVAAHSAVKAGETGTGFADAGFEIDCACELTIDHDLLRVQRFRRDLQALFVNHTPMPGTLLSLDGLTPPAVSRGTTVDSRGNSTFRLAYPNRLLLSGAGAKIADSTELAPESSGGRYWADYSLVKTVSDIRKQLEDALKDKDIVRKASLTGYSLGIYKEERVAIRRMMSCYWEDASIFSLDLAGAVIRQNAFVTKMHDIDWLHSPALRNTMERLIEKYECFFKIMKTYPAQVAVPTLDVDLAWHTHQLDPPSYHTYAVQMTRVFIDHDDKIDENQLSTSFEWTSKTYEKMFEKVYSECTCWYCESVREGHTSRMSRMFKSSKDPVSNDLDRLHSHAPSNPHKSPHISAHNSIKASRGQLYSSTMLDVRHRQIERNYQKACARAKKEGRRPPERDAYAYYPYWGMYYPMPIYVPYMGDPCVSGGMYPANPGCANFAAGAAGNCCSGTCGGAVAAGACAGGACGGGGAVGGACGGGGGGCGGGGGGACGGGGGGGGCGGGGGGGGCGGGGGG